MLRVFDTNAHRQNHRPSLGASRALANIFFEGIWESLLNRCEPPSNVGTSLKICQQCLNPI